MMAMSACAQCDGTGIIPAYHRDASETTVMRGDRPCSCGEPSLGGRDGSGDLMPETAERFDLLKKKRNSGGLSDVETARLKELNAQLVLSKLVTGRYTAEETVALAKAVQS